MGPDSKAIVAAIDEIRKAGLYIKDKGNIDDYLGFNIEDKYNVKIMLTHPHLIDSIISYFKLLKNSVP